MLGHLPCTSVLLCGDFNALSGLWGSTCTNAAGRLISGLVSDLDLVPLNDSLPTFLTGPGMVAPFSSREFSAALASCGARTSPGLDGIEYPVVTRLSSFSLEFLLAVYNRMFRDSSFPESWRNTLVVFIPKTGTGKFRPISLTSALCKLFERLVQRRVEHMAEHGDWIPSNHYGFRRGRSSLDCVATVVCDFLAGFGAGQSSFALALHLKGAFNAVLPGELFAYLM